MPVAAGSARNQVYLRRSMGELVVWTTQEICRINVNQGRIIDTTTPDETPRSLAFEPNLRVLSCTDTLRVTSGGRESVVKVPKTLFNIALARAGTSTAVLRSREHRGRRGAELVVSSDRGILDSTSMGVRGRPARMQRRPDAVDS